MFLENVYDRRIFRYAVWEGARTSLHNVCSLFVAHDIQLGQEFVNGSTLAHMAARLDDIELLRMYVEHGGEVDALHPLLGTPLGIAMRESKRKVLSELLRRGAHLDTGRDGESHFRHLVHCGDIGTVNDKAKKPSIHCRTTRRRCSAAVALPIRAATGQPAYSVDSAESCREALSAPT